MTSTLPPPRHLHPHDTFIPTTPSSPRHFHRNVFSPRIIQSLFISVFETIIVMASLQSTMDARIPTFSQDFWFIKKQLRYKGFCMNVDYKNRGVVYINRPTMEAAWSRLCNEKAMTCTTTSYEELHKNGALLEAILQVSNPFLSKSTMLFAATSS